MFHIVCFLVVERLLYHIIYIFYTMIVILAIFGILIFFLLHKSNHMLRKGLSWDYKNMHPGSWNNNKHEYARQLATGPPCGPAQRVFSKDYFNTRQPQLPRIWPNGRCNASTGGWVFFTMWEASPGLIRARRNNNTGGCKAPYGSQTGPQVRTNVQYHPPLGYQQPRVQLYD